MKTRKDIWYIKNVSGKPGLYYLFRNGVVIPFEKFEKNPINDERYEWHFIRDRYIVATLDQGNKYINETYDSKFDKIREADDQISTNKSIKEEIYQHTREGLDKRFTI